MSPGQGFVANIVTAGLVIGASNFGLPVSTTHVSCGSLFGIGAVTRQAHWRTIRDILLAWIKGPQGYKPAPVVIIAVAEGEQFLE